MSRRTDLVLTLLIATVIPAGATLKMWWDLTHPKVWDYPGDDPHLYRWMVLLIWMVYTWHLDMVLKDERRHKRRVRVAFLLQRAEIFLREKKLKEAEKCLNECKALAHYREPNSAK